MATTVETSTSRLTQRLEAIQNGMNPERADLILEELLRQGCPGNEVMCEAIENRAIRVTEQQQILCEVPVNVAKIKLRSLCERLANKCEAWSGKEMCMYGDSVLIEHPETRRRMEVSIINKPSYQKITILPIWVARGVEKGVTKFSGGDHAASDSQ